MSAVLGGGRRYIMKKANIQNIQNKIYTIRDTRVMLDFDLAELYGVETKVLNQAVKRNRERFPDDFMFQFTDDELENGGERKELSTILGRDHQIGLQSFVFF